VGNNSQSKTMLFLMLPVLASLVACSPANFSATEASSKLSAPNSISGNIPASSNGPLVSSNPIPSGIVVTGNAPFTVELSSDKCIDSNGTDGTDLQFDLIQGQSGKVRSAQITKLPIDSKTGGLDYQSYKVYALYADENGKLYPPDSVYTEVTVREERVYGHYNCLLQTSVIEDTSTALGIAWKDVAPVSKLHMLTNSQEDLVGFAVVNSDTNSLAVRCYK